MHNIRNRREVDLPACMAQPVAEIDLLEIHKEGLIEAADCFKHFASDRQSCAQHPWYHTGARVRPCTQIAIPENGKIANQPAQRALLEEQVERRWEWVARGLQPPI